MTIWALIRAAGIGAFVALFLSIAWGLVSTTGVVTKRVSKPAGNQFHAVVASTGLALLGVHMILLMLHDFLPFRLLDLLVPGRATYRPIATGLGIVAMYALVVLMVSSWLRSRMSTRLWRNLHLLAVPTFVLALLHGVFGGTDTGRPWMMGLYLGSAAVITFLLLVRALSYGYRPPRPAPPERAQPPHRSPRPAVAVGAGIATSASSAHTEGAEPGQEEDPS